MSFVVIPGRTPCLRCFMEEEPAPGTSPTCDTAGVIAPIVHAVAGFQVSEALKILAGREDALHGEVLSLDVWRGRVDAFRPARAREECPACGRHEFSFLIGGKGGQAVTLCGRNAVQVRPSKSQSMGARRRGGAAARIRRSESQRSSSTCQARRARDRALQRRPRNRARHGGPGRCTQLVRAICGDLSDGPNASRSCARRFGREARRRRNMSKLMRAR